MKLISKRAERLYPNGYCVYVLYCNRCKKRRATYQSQRAYRKRGTECPFVLKFTRVRKVSSQQQQPQDHDDTIIDDKNNTDSGASSEKATTNYSERYMLTGGCFMHNHPLTASVLDSQIMQELAKFDPFKCKPAKVRAYIQSSFNKDISYA